MEVINDHMFAFQKTSNASSHHGQLIEATPQHQRFA
jgi:hypothetical protein